MSENLEILRRRETEASSGSDSRPPKKQFPLPSLARLLPWLLVVAFALFTWLLFGERFESGREVELVKVVTARAQDSSNAATGESATLRPAGAMSFDGPTLFQASGWVEPDPLIIRATTLYSGVVQAVHVLEGERVSKDQLLATMVDEDARLDLQTAKAQLIESEATLASSLALVESNQALLQSKEGEVLAEAAKLNEVKDESDRLTRAGKDVFRESQIRQAALRVESQQARVEATLSKVEEAKANLKRSQAAVQLAEGALERARVEVGRRQLALERTKILSPVDGRIQELYAAPGTKRMLNMDGPETATIAKIYQPESLQARIDVPLEEAAKLVIGQPVRLRSSLLPDKIFQGQVTRIDGQADLQRNTLQTKVKILNPADQLRPEMLCRAEFLPASSDEDSSPPVNSNQGTRVAIYVPETALVASGQDASVWVLDDSGKRIERRVLRLRDARRDGHVQVVEGLRPGDFVVNNAPVDLEEGERVKPNNLDSL